MTALLRRSLILTAALIGLLVSMCVTKAQSRDFVQLAADYDIDSSTVTYTSYLGVNGQVLNDWRPGLYRVMVAEGGGTVLLNTSGSVVTPLAEHDLIRFVPTEGEQAGSQIIRRIDSTLALDASVDIYNDGLGLPYTWKKFSSGTGATSGQVPVSQYESFTITWQVDSNATSDGLTVQVECKAAGYLSTWRRLHVETFAGTATGTDSYSVARNAYAFCRVGYALIVGDDAEDEAGVDEKITTTLTGQRIGETQ